MEMLSLKQELSQNAYPGRGIVIGKTPDGKSAVTAYFIMGRSNNSRNRVYSSNTFCTQHSTDVRKHQQSEYHRTARGPSSKAVLEGFQWMKSSVIR